MIAPHNDEVIELPDGFGARDSTATADAVPLAYSELRGLAHRILCGERRDPILDATALVHETYLRLIGQHNGHWRNRAQFFGVAARIMRRVLVDHARREGAAKRGGAYHRVALEETAMTDPERTVDLPAVDEALTRLARFDPRQGRVVELRFFTGLTIRETAQALGVSPATVKREWRGARAWLRREISGDDSVA